MEEVEMKLKASSPEENGNVVLMKEKGKADRKEKGLTLWTAAIFILGEMAGSGVLALPDAVLKAGWAGLAMIAVFCFTSGYSGTRLSICWIMLEERFEVYRKEVQNPYPSIGYEAYGKWMRILVTGCVNITLFGVGTVLLTLSANMTKGVISDLYSLSSCYFIIIIAVILTPCMWLGTPKDFWPIAIGAAVSTAIACVMVVIRSGIDYNRSTHQVFNTTTNITTSFHDEIVYPAPTFSSFCLAFGTILFSYGGASTFPTIQNDMRDRTLFSKAVAIAFTG